MADLVDKLRFVASGEDDMRSHVITAAADEIERLSAELAEWHKLRDPHTLHVNLLRGLPARLSKPQVLHLIGDDMDRIAEIEAENTRLLALVLDYATVCGELSKGLGVEDPLLAELRVLGSRIEA